LTITAISTILATTLQSNVTPQAHCPCASHEGVCDSGGTILTIGSFGTA
jgi:hypothetical protein